ncbi:hypothetical protein [Thermocatellispora tengchongensis]|uniref:hypothetical protein n=1 Tax=Thermocatellispora tengchongensis TaxID=1073253 RepID=UPI003635CEED
MRTVVALQRVVPLAEQDRRLPGERGQAQVTQQLAHQVVRRPEVPGHLPGREQDRVGGVEDGERQRERPQPPAAPGHDEAEQNHQRRVAQQVPQQVREVVLERRQDQGEGDVEVDEPPPPHHPPRLRGRRPGRRGGPAQDLPCGPRHQPADQHQPGDDQGRVGAVSRRVHQRSELPAAFTVEPVRVDLRLGAVPQRRPRHGEPGMPYVPREHGDDGGHGHVQQVQRGDRDRHPAQ